MMKRLTLSFAMFAVGSLLAACAAPSTNTATNTSTNTPASAPARATTSATGGSLKDPKSSIAYQFELVKAGDAEKLKTCMTPRLRDRITQELVDKGKAQAANYTIDDLYASAEMGEADGQKTAKIKMKNGRTLTTLIETDGQWLADTIWFK
ncbi:MAG: hypothetical protein QOD75_3287 [Blastocatellia bacterium]|jgi:hypothetical protein|nr:hypothetical protein [Blastocatellia bacterium]